MTEKLFDVEGLRILAFKLPCEDQFRLASFVAENVGYVLTPQAAMDREMGLEQRIEELERKMAVVLPDLI